MRFLILAIAAASLAACETPAKVSLQSILVTSYVRDAQNRDVYGPDIPVYATIRYENVGKGAVPVAANVGLYLKENHAQPDGRLGGVDLPPDPKKPTTQQRPFYLPHNAPPGPWNICADIDDGVDAVAQVRYRVGKARVCAPVTIAARAHPRADLVVEGLKVIRNEQASTLVEFRVRNRGEGAAAAFRMGALRRSPLAEIFLTTCAFSEKDRATATVPGGCRPIEQPGLSAGAVSAPINAYVTYSSAEGSAYVRNQIKLPKPPPAPRPVYAEIDILADYCGPPDFTMPRFCDVDEDDEINNAATLIVNLP